MIRDTTRNPGTEDAPNYRRRRSASFVPAVRWDLEAAERAFEAQRLGQRDGEHRRRGRYDDPLAALPVIPKPVRRSRLRPSLKRFMSGRSSLWAVAKALHDRHSRQRALKARMSQSVIWAGLDQKELVEELNEQSRNSPDLPKSLSVRLRVCRTTLVSLVHELGMRGYRYADIEDVYIFFKAAEKHTRKTKSKVGRGEEGKHDSHRKIILRNIRVAEEDRVTEALANNVSLSSASVVIFVGANHPPGGLPNDEGLGHLYMSTGKVVSGESALALRVLDALSKK
eukprot:g4850.t1